MEKQIKEFEIDYYIGWEEVKISEIKKDIEELEKLGATHINIECGIDYDEPFVEIKAICKRLETDEEFELRKKEIEAHAERIKQRDLEQLANLKAKYGL